MGLRCSLLGHSYGETTVEREREERGSEVVTVVREVESCQRCEETRVVSENKEVTSVVDAEDVGLDEAGEVQGAGSFNEDEFEPPDSPEEEDAEIIEETTGDREPGEWPEEPGGDAPVADRDSEPTDDATESEDGPGGGDHATVLDDDAGQTSLDEATAPDEGTAAESEATPRPDRDDGGESLTVPEGSFACPECGLEVDAESSFRAGDACPECQRGYLEQVE